MKELKRISSLRITGIVSLALVACGKGESSNNSDDAKTASKFPDSMPKNAAKQGGTSKVVLETDTSFMGIFPDQLVATSIDTQIASPGVESLFDTDDYHKNNDKGPATIKVDNKIRPLQLQ